MGSSFLSCSVTSIDDRIEKMIYFPPQIDQHMYFSALNTQRSKMVEYYTKSNKKVSAVYITPENNSKPEKYIVFSHGNGSDIFTMFGYLSYLSNHLCVGIFAYDYLGYGLSESIEPSEQGCYDSMDATVYYLLNNWKMDEKNIFLVGQSLGTGITVDYISKNKWNTPVILISPYKSICTVIANTSCVAPIDKFTSKKKLKNVSCPIKIFHGKSDEVINVSHGMEMYNNLKNKTLSPVWFDGIGHNNILDVITKDHFMEVLNYHN
jgi:pimeloyl-ACP methyl ester carboxylesterase